MAGDRQASGADSQPLLFGVLGPLEVWQNGSHLAVKGRSERALLALLLTAPGRVFSVASIVGGLWGEWAPPTADRTVQQYVSRLRRSLPADILLTRPPGYMVDVRPEQVDAHRFRDMVRRGRVELSGGDPAAAATTLRAALLLWRGEPFGEFEHVSFAAGERTALDELRLVAIEDRVQADLATGAGPELVAEIETLLTSCPLRERLWAQLMTALYRSGRQADALMAYQRARRQLVDELGVEPGPELRSVEAQVLGHDPSLQAAPSSVVPVLPTPLAAAGPTFVGRESELRLLVDSLNHAESGQVVRILVVGSHGIGKTRLLAEVGRVALERGATVRYARGDGPAPQGAGSGVAVLAYDDLQEATLDNLEALVEGVEAAGPPALLLFAAVESELSQAHRFLVRRLADIRLQLRPLVSDEVATLVRLYVPDAELPEALAHVEMAAGVPLDVHDRASKWAEERAARRVGGATAALSATRDDLLDTRSDIVEGVVDLQRARAQRAAHAPDRSLVVCPYKGLTYFDSADAPYFFGRERLTAELVAHLVGASLLAVVGPSGSGKSSVVRAGLLPALAGGVLPASDRWSLVVTTPHEPFPDLPVDDRSVVVIDQFEEVFTGVSPHERQTYVDWLLAMVCQPGAKTTVVLTIRADYYGRCAESPELARLVSANTVLVPPMAPEELRATVDEPAHAAGLQVEDGVADAVVREAGQEPGALPLVSTALLSLWERRRGRRLTLAGYHESGGVSGAVAELAETTYAALTADQQLVARRTFLRLADIGEGAEFVRRRVPISEIAPQGDANARVVLDTLAGRRLLTVSGETVEVAHEALLREWPRLRGWLEEDEAGRALRGHLAPAARDWENRGRDETELYRGPRLIAALDWAREHEADLTSTERAFLERGKSTADREVVQKRRTIRRLRFGAAGLAALLVAALGAGFVAVDQRNDATRSSLEADVRALQVRATNESRWDRALLYAVQAYRLDPSSDSRAALLQTVQRSPEATSVLTAGQSLVTLAISADGTRLVASGSDGTVFVWDALSGELTHTAPRATAFFAQSLDVSPDGRFVAVVGVPAPSVEEGRDRGFQLVVVDLEQAPPSVRFFESGPVDSAMFASDARTVVALGVDGSVRYVDAVTGVVERTLDIGVSEPAGTLDAADGREFMVATSEAGGVSAWEVESGRVIWTSTEQDVVAGSVSADGSALVIGYADGRLDVIDVQANGGIRRQVPFAPADPLGDLAWAPDGSTFAGTTQERTVLVWDTATLEPRAVLRGHWGVVTQLAYAPDGRSIHAAGLDRAVITWDLTGTRGIVRQIRARPAPDAISGDQFSAATALASNGSVGMTRHLDGRIEVFDLETGETFEVFVAGDEVYAAPGELGRFGLVSVLLPGRVEVHVIDVQRQALLPHVFSAEWRDAFDVVVMPDGKSLLLAGGRRLDRWDLATGERVSTFEAQQPITAAAPHPDGRLVALSNGASDCFIDVIDVVTGERVASLDTTALNNSATCFYPVAFSPDGRWLVGAIENGRVVVWDTASWGVHDIWETVPTFGLQKLAFTPDSRFLITGSGGAASLWNIEQGGRGGVQLQVDPVRSESTVEVGTSDDSDRLMTYTEGTGVRAWTVEPTRLLEHACLLVGHNLTQEEWDAVLPDRPYERTCTGAA